MNNSYADKIQQYLYGQLTAAERKDFEKALRQDADLKKAYIQFNLSEKADDYFLLEQQRTLANQVRLETGPLPIPQLNWWDKLWLAFSAQPIVTGALLATIMLSGLWLLYRTQAVPSFQPVEAHMLRPFNFSQAGGGTMDARDVLQRSSDLYYGLKPGGRDSLAQLAQSCGQFCMAHYYLAHWELKNGHYAEARKGLEECLAQRSTVEQDRYNKSIGKMKVNLLLAKLGEHPDQWKAIRAQLNDMLENDPDLQGPVNEEAREKAVELQDKFK
ncbi:MAG: hypothetical protein ACOYNO_00095 [Saprospiraceae bacterium]